MNLYIVVEGRRTEMKVYSKWFRFLLPKLTKINNPYDVQSNNYYLFNGNGYPALLYNHLKNSIDEVNEIGAFSYLMIVLDVDESTIEDRTEEVNNFIIENELTLSSSELVIITQNRCIETWFLGNRSIFKENPQDSRLSEFVRFYNVKNNDPEFMGILDGYNTHAQFHAEYATSFLRERNIKYSKKNPSSVTEEHYLNGLISRGADTDHIQSFMELVRICAKINRML